MIKPTLGSMPCFLRILMAASFWATVVLLFILCRVRKVNRPGDPFDPGAGQNPDVVQDHGPQVFPGGVQVADFNPLPAGLFGFSGTS